MSERPSSASPPMETAGYAPDLAPLVPIYPRTGLSNAALFCGICGVLGFLPAAVLGLGLGLTSILWARRVPARCGGPRRALAGLVLGLLGLTVVPLGTTTGWFKSPIARALEVSTLEQDAERLRAVAAAVKSYSSRFGRLPASLKALTDAGLISAADLQDPAARGAASGAPRCFYCVVDFSDTPVEAFDSSWILAWCDPNTHGGEGGQIYFLDGHSEFVREPRFANEVQRFQAAYQQACGKPPALIPPE